MAGLDEEALAVERAAALYAGTDAPQLQPRVHVVDAEVCAVPVQLVRVVSRGRAARAGPRFRAQLVRCHDDGKEAGKVSTVRDDVVAQHVVGWDGLVLLWRFSGRDGIVVMNLIVLDSLVKCLC